jgi:Tfp pilus assembly protein PilF
LIINLHFGWHHLYARRYDLAVEQLHKTLDLDSTFLLARLFLGEAYEHSGQLEHAVAEFERACALSGRRSVYLGALGRAYAVVGREPERARRSGS